MNKETVDQEFVVNSLREVARKTDNGTIKVDYFYYEDTDGSFVLVSHGRYNNYLDIKTFEQLNVGEVFSLRDKGLSGLLLQKKTDVRGGLNSVWLTGLYSGNLVMCDHSDEVIPFD